MGLIQWATNPWGQSVPIHVAWSLIWIAVIAGFCFMVAHALYLIVVKPPKRFAERKAEAVAAGIPDRVPRHTLAARLFHWVMAASMIALLITAFLPKVGIQFNWVVYHWIAGLVLTASILFHVVHSTFFLDFWSIWPDKTDLIDAKNRTLRFFGKDAEQVCEVSAGEQAVSCGDSAVGTGGDRHGLVYDEARGDGDLRAEPVSVQRYDLGPDVCAARTDRRRADCAGDDACVHGNPAGEAADYQVDDLRMDEQRFLSGGTRHGALGREGHGGDKGK